jgi:hypothetical protein
MFTKQCSKWRASQGSKQSGIRRENQGLKVRLTPKERFSAVLTIPVSSESDSEPERKEVKSQKEPEKAVSNLFPTK